METEIKNNQANKNTSKVTIIFWAIIAAVIAFILVISVFKGNLFNFNLSQITVPETKKEEAPLVLSLKTINGTNTNEQQIQVFLSAVKPTEIVAFQLKINRNSSIESKDLTLEINPELKNQAWSFPIARIEDNNIKISAFKKGNAPYQVEKEILLATLINKSGQNISLGVDNTETIFYAGENVSLKIPFTTVLQ